MDFFKLSQSEYRNYLATVRGMMAENNFKHEGVAFFVISSMPELEELAKQKAWSRGELPLALYEQFCHSYQKAEKIFTERFNMFFERCVKDKILYSTFMNSLGAVEDFVSPFILADEGKFADLYASTSTADANKSMQQFASLLNTQSLDIASEAESCRQSCYY
jgi:hypothetical protein